MYISLYMRDTREKGVQYTREHEQTTRQPPSEPLPAKASHGTTKL